VVALEKRVRAGVAHSLKYVGREGVLRSIFRDAGNNLCGGGGGGGAHEMPHREDGLYKVSQRKW
jgi:hypothetical protein